MDSAHSKDVDYAELLPSLFRMNAGYFLIQLASEADKERVYRLIGDSIRTDANGVKHIALVGAIDPLNPTVETPEEVADALETAARYIPTDQLGATDDCGFSPFSMDLKLRHGSPDFAPGHRVPEDHDPQAGRAARLAAARGVGAAIRLSAAAAPWPGEVAVRAVSTGPSPTAGPWTVRRASLHHRLVGRPGRARPHAPGARRRRRRRGPARRHRGAGGDVVGGSICYDGD